MFKVCAICTAKTRVSRIPRVYKCSLWYNNIFTPHLSASMMWSGRDSNPQFLSLWITRYFESPLLNSRFGCTTPNQKGVVQYLPLELNIIWWIKSLLPCEVGLLLDNLCTQDRIRTDTTIVTASWRQRVYHFATWVWCLQLTPGIEPGLLDYFSTRFTT